MGWYSEEVEMWGDVIAAQRTRIGNTNVIQNWKRSLNGRTSKDEGLMICGVDGDCKNPFTGEDVRRERLFVPRT